MSNHKQQTPYAGCVGDGEPVETAPHVLVSGPTGQGKTTRVLAPGALLWRGPRVVISSKTDYLKWLVEKRIAARGPLYVMDLAGELDASFDWLQGVEYTMVTSDPTSLIDGDDDAVAMASLLLKVGDLGASDGGSSGGDAFWETLATQPLAALLLAGKASGQGIAWTMQASSKVAKRDEGDTSPSWANAYELIAEDSIHAADLSAVAEMEPKIRDSITATMKSGLAPWLLTNVRGTGKTTPFAPVMLEASDGKEPTLAIIAPADGVAAGAAVGAVETVIRHWRRGIERGLDRLLLSVDEVVNTCPIPKLPTYVTEARGLGVACVIAVQSTTQMQLKWGETGAKVLREVFPAVLVLQGAPERELLEAAAWWDGEADVWRESIDAQQRRSMSAERAPRTTASSLRPASVEEGRLLLFGRKGVKVDLPGLWRM